LHNGTRPKHNDKAERKGARDPEKGESYYSGMPGKPAGSADAPRDWVDTVRQREKKRVDKTHYIEKWGKKRRRNVISRLSAVDKNRREEGNPSREKLKKIPSL